MDCTAGTRLQEVAAPPDTAEEVRLGQGEHSATAVGVGRRSELVAPEEPAVLAAAGVLAAEVALVAEVALAAEVEPAGVVALAAEVVPAALAETA